MDAQQEIFTQIKINLEKIGYSVYDGALPAENTPYPFIYLGDCQQTDDPTKTALFGNVFQTIHVWSNKPNRRGDVSLILGTIKNVCRQIDKTNNYNWLVRNVNQQILADNTTNSPLLHGIIEIEFKFN